MVIRPRKAELAGYPQAAAIPRRIAQARQILRDQIMAAMSSSSLSSSLPSLPSLSASATRAAVQERAVQERGDRGTR
jgi:hypothetical protein